MSRPTVCWTEAVFMSLYNPTLPQEHDSALRGLLASVKSRARITDNYWKHSGKNPRPSKQRIKPFPDNSERFGAGREAPGPLSRMSCFEIPTLENYMPRL